MPYVNIKLTQEGATSEQKAAVVIIEEVPTDNWGIAGESVTVRRKEGR